MSLPFSVFNHRTVRIVMIAVPCVLAVTLGILQYGWISRAAVTEGRRRLQEEQRLIESSTLDVRRAVESSFDDLRLAVSLMRTAMGMGTAPGSETAIAEQALSGWFQQTPFRLLIRGVWLMADDGKSAGRNVHITIDSQSGKLGRAVVPSAGLPAALQPATRLLRDRSENVQSAVDQARTILGDRGYVLVWAAIGSRSSALSVLEVDTAAYLDATLPYYLKRDAPAYTVTVHPASELPSDVPLPSDGQRVARIGTKLLLAVPNVWYAALLRTSLDAGPSAPAYLPGSPGGSPGGSPSIPIRFAFKDSVGFITFEYPEATGSRGAASWLVSNMAVSISIVLILLAALVGALLLFARMRELRTAEMEFVASMSHELRLPITTIRVIADNLSAGIVRDETRMTKYADQIRRQTSRLSSMVEGMLLTAGLQGEGRQPNVAPFRPSEAVARVVEELVAIAAEHDVTVSVDRPDAEVGVQGDAGGFSLVVRNLLMNAILHAFPPAPGEPRRVWIRVSLDRPSLLRVEVSDNGPGIPKSEQKAIFEPFARTSKSLSEQHQGSGLGLHIARRVVRLSEGSLSLESPYQDSTGEVHRGCRFVATMKCAEMKAGE